MNEHVLVAVSSIVVLGILAQWIAWRMRVPSILLLLIFGVMAGPVLGLLEPDSLFGQLLFPIVSVSVAVILFEGGLSLRFRELRQTGRAVRNLVTIGALVSWLATAAAAYWILGFSKELALLLGGILVVTGPTVIGPLLRFIRPSGQSGPVLKWEGIVIDPIGAILAVLVFEVVFSAGTGHAGTVVAVAAVKTLVVGGGLGTMGALLLTVCLRRYWIPDYLQSPVALMLAVAAFAGSNLLQEESGLLAVTAMGIIVANQRGLSLRPIVEFKENLGVLLISSLFILLAARIDLEDLARLGWKVVAFLAVLIVVVRPLSVWLSTLGSPLDWRERTFVALVAPRGIVAAAVSSVFALRLLDAGFEEGHLLVPTTFAVITGTVLFYGPAAALAARWLGLAKSAPQGILFVGAQPWVRALAQEVQEHGFRVLLVDSNRDNVSAARMDGLPAVCGNALSEEFHDELDLDGIGKLLALTPNDEVNSLAAIQFVEFFGRANVYQLVPKGEAETRRGTAPGHLRGRLLFSREATFDFFMKRSFGGAELRSTNLTEKFGFEAFQDFHGPNALPLLLVNEGKELTVLTTEDPPTPKAGQVLIGLVDRASGGSDKEAS